MEYLRETRGKLKRGIIPATDDFLMTAGIVNQKLGFPTPSLLFLVVFNNKNLSRTVLGKFGCFYGLVKADS